MLEDHHQRADRDQHDVRHQLVADEELQAMYHGPQAKPAGKMIDQAARSLDHEQELGVDQKPPHGREAYRDDTERNDPNGTQPSVDALLTSLSPASGPAEIRDRDSNVSSLSVIGWQVGRQAVRTPRAAAPYRAVRLFTCSPCASATDADAVTHEA
jgi:hypothetical protein